jgi:signal transduction histidine kinase
MGLADELKGAVATADRLMQRVQHGAQRKGSKRWRGEVRDYARATLKAKALAVELEKQVGVTSDVVKALDNLSLHIETTETDAASVLIQLADFLRESLPLGATLEVDAPVPCVVGVPRTIVVAMLSSAIESALFNVLEVGSPGRIALRSSMTSKKEIVVEIADDGAPAATLLRASSKNPFFYDSCAIRLRQLRKRARRAGGEMTIESDASGNLLTLRLPSVSEIAMSSSSDGPLRARSRRARRAASRQDGTERRRGTT